MTTTNRTTWLMCAWFLGLAACQNERTGVVADASVTDASLDGGADAGARDVGTVDDAGEQTVCEGNQVERASLISTSVEELRGYFGVESGLEGGELVFQEAITRDVGFECTNDLSSLSYVVALPEALRPRDVYDRVAVVWGFNGDFWIVLLLVDDPPTALAEGRLPTSAIVELNEDTPEEAADAFVALVQERYSLATLERFEPNTFELRFPARSTHRIEPAVSQEALAALRFFEEHELVYGINILRLGFSRSIDAEFAEARVVSDAQIELDCLRTEFGTEPRYTETSLPGPFGTGRTYECDVCPIGGICGPE